MSAKTTISNSAFVEDLRKNNGFTVKQAQEALDTVFKTIEDAVVSDCNVRLYGLGVLKVVDRKARIGRNPRNGKEVKIPARKAVKFDIGKNLKKELNK